MLPKELQQPIYAWLATLDIPRHEAEQPHQSHHVCCPRKRRRVESHVSKSSPSLSLPLSPPPSQSPYSLRRSMDPAHATGTKRKHSPDELSNYGEEGQSVEGGDDIDATPRPSRQSERSIERISTPSITSTSTTSSRTSSPSKQLKRLALEPDGFVHRMMSRSRTHLPASLASLKAELKAINDGFRLLPHTKRAEFVDFDIPDHAFLAETDPDPDGIRYPSRDTVAWLFDQAEECEINSHGEPSWNTELHLPMMEWALRPDRRRGLVDYTYCTGAQVAKSYKPRRSPSNMIDFCMVIRPPDESPEAHRIDAVRYRRPDVTINHTDHGILCKSPIAVSFETKRPGADIEKATVQMGTWHAAQWRGIFRDLTRPPALEFLPGVVISGHTWTFVASTFENGKCVYYSGAELGKTSDEIGIIKVLIALQHLASWAQNTYWPAFKFDLLDL